MEGEKRRNKIITDLKKSDTPLSGSYFAKQYKVSRQVVVQDIALLRAAGYDIISTTKGYVVSGSASFSRVFNVSHDDNQIRDELNTFVDLGGYVVDVIVDHPIYGTIRADLNVHSRKDVEEFMSKLEAGTATPLNHLTSGEHRHTVETEDMETLDLIAKELKSKGYLK